MSRSGLTDPQSAEFRNSQPAAPLAQTEPRTAGRSRLAVAAVVAAIAVSFVVRLRNLDAPLIDRHEFRQTQTASSVYWFLQEGLDPLHYQTPVLGPPWRVPMEFPTYQIVAALVAKTGLWGLDASCRITSLAFFYLSALALYILCRRFFPAAALRACIVLAYVWFPFTLVYGRAAMIDFASVAFALGYLEACLRWLDGDWRLRVVLLATALGVLGYTTKVTTMPIVIIILGPMLAVQGLREFLRWRQERRTAPAASRRALATLAVLGVMLVAPVGVELGWLRYSDRVKAGSPVAVKFSSKELGSWNFFTWEQLTTAANWKTIWERVHTAFLPGAVLFFALASLGTIFRGPWRAALFFFLAIVGAAVTITVHFNLYVVHDYYLMAIAPVFALVVGVGLYEVYCVALAGRLWTRLALGLFLAFSMWSDGVADYLTPSYGRDAVHALEVGPYTPFGELSRALGKITRPDEYSVVCNDCWSSKVLYYARRKGLMLYYDQMLDLPAVRAMLKQHNFTTVAYFHPVPQLLEQWKYAHFVEYAEPYVVFRVSDTEAQSPLPVRLHLDPAGKFAGCEPLQQVEMREQADGLTLRATDTLPAIGLPAFDTTQAESLLVKIELTAPCDTLMVLYYLTPGQAEYNDQHARVIPIKAGRNTIYRKLPAAGLHGRFRLDPGRMPGDYCLHGLDIWATPQTP